MPISVSVIIPTLNGRRTIGPCLDAVLAQEYDGPIDVLVIDSGSRDGTLDDVRARPAVRLHRIHPLAFDHGDTRNLGAGLTTGEAIVLLVQDAEPVGKHWLRNLVQNLAEPHVAGSFSRIVPRPDATPLARFRCEDDLCYGTQRVESRMRGLAAWRDQTPHGLRVACNFNDVSSVVRRSVWEALPLVRGPFGEDIKFARAAIEAGWTIVFEPTSEVLHSHEYSVRTVYNRTRIDAVFNMQHLHRWCVERPAHVLLMTYRFWAADWARLRQQRLSTRERLKWAALSPAFRFSEFYGFWRGGRDAARRARYSTSPVPAPTRPLRILMVVHGFPPESWAGTEVVSLTLARSMRRRGHDVSLFVRSPGRPGLADRSVFREDFDGFRVHRFVNHLAYSASEESYRFAPAEDAFDRILAEERPDVVHAQHLIHLSTGIVDRCRTAGVPCIVSLSDYWARCARVQLIRPDHHNCTVPPPGLGCAACLTNRPGLIDPLARVDAVVGGVMERWAQRVPPTLVAQASRWQRIRQDAASLMRRERWFRDLLRRADGIIVPSATSKRLMLEFGLTSDEIVLSDHGIDTAWLSSGFQARRPRVRGEPLRVGFLGSLVWYKGLDVLSRAVAFLPPGSACLHVHGDHIGGSDTAAAAEFRRVAAEARRLAGERVIFHGRYHHDELAAIHGRLDVVVVPSVWQETFGLVVRECHLAHTPVVGSDIAGIAEGIEHDVNGLLFKAGDAGALRTALQRFLDEPNLGARLSAAVPRVKTDAEEAAEFEWRYRQAISSRRVSS